MKIYLDLAFLEEFFLTNDENDSYHQLKRLLCSAESPAELVVDFDFEEIYKNPEKRVLFRQIANKLPVSDIEIVAKANNADFHETKEPNLFFMNSDTLKTERFGCFSMTSKQLEKGDLLVFPESFRIDSSKENWSFLNSCKLPCNSLILTDNYLFSNDETFENTFSILKNLMPPILEIDFDLTIIGYDAKKSFKDISEQSNRILSELKKNYDYNINLTIIREDHHGRYIHTNYTRFWSDKGFGLFKNKKLKPTDNTTVEFGTIALFGKQTSVYKTRIEELEKCRKINRVERSSDKVVGGRKNRLLK